jgi:8-oxo-dGTP diphosphatase
MQKERGWFNVSLKVFLKNDKGEILALAARPTSSLTGYYDLPGGRVDEDEFETDYETQIKRELSEEIGSLVKYELTLKPVSFSRHSYYSQRQGKEIRGFYICFEAKYLGGEIKISGEHIGYKWINVRQIKLEDYFLKGPLEAVRRYLDK